MPDHKLRETTMPTPSRSNLAQILLDLRGVEGVGLCNLQQSDIQLCLESYRQENNLAIENDQSSQQDTCNCRKSKCLKLYCQCFAARATCSSSCRCVSCENRPDNATVRDAAVSMILERNPNAFDSKYRPTAPSSIGTTSMSSSFTAITSVAHKNGCRCRKSMCLKKYCECYQGGVPCSSICTCLSCQNTGPATLLTASSSSTSIAATGAAAALQRASSEMLLSNRDQLSDQSMFANPSRFSNESIRHSGNSSEASSSYAEKAASAEAGSVGVNRPPLVPSLKRKKDSGASSSEGAEGRMRDLKALKREEDQHPQDQDQKEEQEQTFAPPLTPAGSNMSMSMSMNLSREQQKQLLNELLFQELQSQGMLTSPLTSYLTNNCPGLMQSSEGGTTIDDIMNLFKRSDSHISAGGTGATGVGAGVDCTVGTPAGLSGGGGTLLSYTPANTAAGASVSSNLKTEPSTALPHGRAGLTSASPNTFSIATALALLAASGHFQSLAKQQQQQQVVFSGSVAGSGGAMGICEDSSSSAASLTGAQQQVHSSSNNNSTVRSRCSVPTSALALASARKEQQVQMSDEHDPFSSLSKMSGGAHACTPLAAAADRGGEVPSSGATEAGNSAASRTFSRFSQSSSGGLTDGETTVGSRRSCSTGRSSLSDESMCSLSGGGVDGRVVSEDKEIMKLLQHKYHPFSSVGPSKEAMLLGLPAKALFTSCSDDGPVSPDNHSTSTNNCTHYSNHSTYTPTTANAEQRQQGGVVVEREDEDDDLLVRLLATKENAVPNKNQTAVAAAGAMARLMVREEETQKLHGVGGGGRQWR